MDDLVERLERNSGWRNERWQCVTDPALLTEAAARITELETALAEAEGRVIADVVAWLRDRMRQAPKDEFSQAACDVIFVLVAALETGEWKK